LQLHLFQTGPPVVHYFDSDGALHSGYLVRRIKRGRRKGRIVVSNSDGHILVPYKVRNIEFG